MHFWRLVEILDKRKWLIVLSMILTAALTYGATRLIGSKWVATATLRSVPPPSSDLVAPSREEVPEMEGRRSRAQAVNYDAMLKSQPVLLSALQLIGDTQFPRDFQQGLAQNVKLEAVGSSTFELSVIDPRPERAMRYANALASALESYTGKAYQEQQETLLKLLRGNLAEADANLAATTRRYDDYRRRRNLLASQEDSLGIALGRFQSARGREDELREKLSEAQARLQESERELARLPKTIEYKPEPVAGAAIMELERQLAQADANLTALRTRYTDEVLEVQRAQAARDALEARLAQERAKQKPPAPIQQPNPAVAALQQTIASLRGEVRGYQAHLAALASQSSTLEADLRAASDVQGPLGALARQIARESEIRDNLAARLQAARMAYDGVRGYTPLKLLNPVGEYNPPINTKPGRAMKLMILAVLCALLGSAGLVVALESVDRRVKTVQDAELSLPAPVCAAIPQPLGTVTTTMLPRVTELQPLSMNSEAYRFLGLHLLNARARSLRSLMLISAKAEQGSTSTVTNLAITLAQAGHRVIVVDANVRSPEVHTVFGLPNEVGFTTLLENPDETILQSALLPTSVERLQVIPSGPTPDNPWQLFRSENLQRVSHRLLELADYVLYDTPSALAFTDALNLTPVVDAAILCVRALEPPSGAERRLVESLKMTNVEILGVVLNDVPASLLESYQNYQRYYRPTVRPVAALSGGGVGTLEATDVGTLIDLPGSRNGSNGRRNGKGRDGH